MVARLTAEGVPHSWATTLEQLPEAIEAVAPGYLVREVHPQLGDMVHPLPAVTFDEPVKPRASPAVGEHTAEILAELDGD